MSKHTRVVNEPIEIYGKLFSKGQSIIIDLSKGRFETEKDVFYIDYDDIKKVMSNSEPFELIKIKFEQWKK